MKPIEDMDLYALNRALDVVKAKVFMGKGAAFYAPLLCQLDFYWTRDIKTAGTNGNSLVWNPEWFMSLPEETRQTVLLHEVDHFARLHRLRRGDRDPLVWNWACDVRINNDLQAQGYSFKGTNPWKDATVGDMPEEAIYDILWPQYQAGLLIGGAWGHDDIDDDSSLGSGEANEPGDMHEPDDIDINEAALNNTIIGQVVGAMHQAKLAGRAGDIPGNIELLVNQFLAPVVNWEILLQKFFSDMLQGSRSWRRPNRRYPDMYLPSKAMDDGRLDHLVFFEDVSGSVSDAEIFRFNSEAKYIKDQFKPRKMTIVTFDDHIQNIVVIEEDDDFDEIKITGRGGTDLEPVADWIEENKPTAAVVFSDLCCNPMRNLEDEIPLIWVTVNNTGATVPYGEQIHIKG